jgi:hypothetical protein
MPGDGNKKKRDFRMYPAGKLVVMMGHTTTGNLVPRGKETLLLEIQNYFDSCG